MVLEGRIKSFNTCATAVEAAQESWWQFWKIDLRVPTLDSQESDLRVRTPECWDSDLRVPGTHTKVLTLERRVLGQYRRVPRYLPKDHNTRSKGPRTVQKGPKTLPMDHNTRAKGPRTVQKGPKTLPKDHNTRAKGPRTVQKGPKTLPKDHNT